MTTNKSADGPFDFARNLWEKMGGELPGMISPTTDIDELERRLADLKAVESWLKMNLTMLQLSIQGLDMQCSTLKAVRELARSRPDLIAPPSAPTGTAKKTAPKESNCPIHPEESFQMLWPWALMQQIQQKMHKGSGGSLPEAENTLTPSNPGGKQDQPQPMLWPWALMQEIQERMQGTIEQPAPTPPKKTPAKAAKTSRKAS